MQVIVLPSWTVLTHFSDMLSFVTPVTPRLSKFYPTTTKNKQQHIQRILSILQRIGNKSKSNFHVCCFEGCFWRWRIRKKRRSHSLSATHNKKAGRYALLDLIFSKILESFSEFLTNRVLFVTDLSDFVNRDFVNCGLWESRVVLFVVWWW